MAEIAVKDKFCVDKNYRGVFPVPVFWAREYRGTVLGNFSNTAVVYRAVFYRGTYALQAELLMLQWHKRAVNWAAAAKYIE